MKYDLLTNWSNLQAEFNVGDMWNTEVLLVNYLFLVILVSQQMCTGMSFSDLPLHMQNKILYKFSDACDIINLGQATPTLHILSENNTLWKKLCHFHFSDRPVSITLNRLSLSLRFYYF